MPYPLQLPKDPKCGAYTPGEHTLTSAAACSTRLTPFRRFPYPAHRRVGGDEAQKAREMCRYCDAKYRRWGVFCSRCCDNAKVGNRVVLCLAIRPASRTNGLDRFSCLNFVLGAAVPKGLLDIRRRRVIQRRATGPTSKTRDLCSSGCTVMGPASVRRARRMPPQLCERQAIATYVKRKHRYYSGRCRQVQDSRLQTDVTAHTYKYTKLSTSHVSSIYPLWPN